MPLFSLEEKIKLYKMYAKMQDIVHTHKLISPSLSFTELVRMKNHIFLLNFTHKLSLSQTHTHFCTLYQGPSLTHLFSRVIVAQI